jgi:hypothetical protein
VTGDTPPSSITHLIPTRNLLSTQLLKKNHQASMQTTVTTISLRVLELLKFTEPHAAGLVASGELIKPPQMELF